MKIIGDGGHAAVIKDMVSLFRDVPELCAVVAVGDNATRKRLVAEHPNELWALLVHPFTYVSKSASFGEGTVIMAGAIVQARAKIGRHCIINTGATVDHDCVVGDYTHIAPGAHLCGGVIVGEGALVGVGVGIEPRAHVPAWSIVKRERYTVCPTK